jgi:L-lactate utilization protein LutB
MNATEPRTIERLPVNAEFARPADAEAIERAADALRANNFDVHIVEDGEAARALVLSLIPEGAEVGQGASLTLEQIGVTAAIE